MRLIFSLFICLLSNYSALYSYTKLGVVGDSISFPFPVRPYECYHYYLAKDLDREMNEPIRVINYSFGGAMTNTLVDRLDHMIKNDRPDIIIIALGINDCVLLKPITETLQAFEEAINLLESENIPFMIGTVDPSSLPPLPNKPYRYQHYKAHVYDRLMNDHPDVLFFPFLTNKLINNPIYYKKDPIHVNEKAHRIIANEIKPLLIKLIFESKNNGLN